MVKFCSVFFKRWERLQSVQWPSRCTHTKYTGGLCVCRCWGTYRANSIKTWVCWLSFKRIKTRLGIEGKENSENNYFLCSSVTATEPLVVISVIDVEFLKAICLSCKQWRTGSFSAVREMILLEALHFFSKLKFLIIFNIF